MNAREAKVIDEFIDNAEGILLEARTFLNKCVAAHTLLAGSCTGEDSPFLADEDEDIQAFAENAAHVVADLQTMRRYLDDLRPLVAGRSAVDRDNDMAAAE